MADDSGSTLIEVLIAMLVLTSGVFAMAQLFVLAGATNTVARHTTVAATLAAQKLEQILSSDIAPAPESVDHMDAAGRVLSRDGPPSSDAVYTRRWSIDALTPDTVRILVRVGRTDRSGRLRRMSDETRLVSIKRRAQP